MRCAVRLCLSWLFEKVSYEEINNPETLDVFEMGDHTSELYSACMVIARMVLAMTGLSLGICQWLSLAIARLVLAVTDLGFVICQWLSLLVYVVLEMGGHIQEKHTTWIADPDMNIYNKSVTSTKPAEAFVVSIAIDKAGACLPRALDPLLFDNRPVALLKELNLVGGEWFLTMRLL